MKNAENENRPVILFLTRAFNGTQIGGLATNVNSPNLENYFCYSEGEIKSDFIKNLQDDVQNQFLKSDFSEFWINFKNIFEEKQHCKIHKNFGGYLKQLIIKNDESSHPSQIFFYHHWFDQQFTKVQSVDILYDFLDAIIDDILVALKINKIADLHLVMHNGDFIDDPKNPGTKISMQDIKEKLKDKSDKVTIYRFHHENGVIWERVLNSIDLPIALLNYKDLNQVENSVLQLFGHDYIITRFKELLNR